MEQRVENLQVKPPLVVAIVFRFYSTIMIASGILTVALVIWLCFKHYNRSTDDPKSQGVNLDKGNAQSIIPVREDDLLRQEYETSKMAKAKLINFSCKVAGFSIRYEPSLTNLLIPYTTILLQREPDNDHDFFAVKVMIYHKFIGYIPRTDSARIAVRIDAGRLLNCYVEKFYGNCEYQELRIRIAECLGNQ